MAAGVIAGVWSLAWSRAYPDQSGDAFFGVLFVFFGTGDGRKQETEWQRHKRDMLDLILAVQFDRAQRSLRRVKAETTLVQGKQHSEELNNVHTEERTVNII